MVCILHFFELLYNKIEYYFVYLYDNRLKTVQL